MKKRLYSFFLPWGIQRVKKIKFLPKMLILLLILLCPIMVLAYFLHVEIEKVTDFAIQEQKGVQYLEPVHELLVQLTGSDVDVLSADGALEESIRKIDQQEALWGKELQTTEQWQKLKAALGKTEPGSRPVAISQTMELISKTGDSSNLVLDPDLDSYYLMDAYVFKYPLLISNLHKMDLLPKSNAAAGTEPAFAIEMAVLRGEIQAALEGADSGLKKAATENSSLQPVLAVFQKNSQSVSVLTRSFTENKAAVAMQTGSLALVRQELQQTAQLTGKNLYTLLDIRIKKAQEHERNMILVLCIFVGAAMYFILLLYLSMDDSIGRILQAAKAYAAGDWKSSITITSKDEMADIAQAMNMMQAEIKPMVTAIVDSSTEVTAASEELHASAEQASDTAARISEISGQMVLAMEKQGHSIRSGCFSMQEADTATASLVQTAGSAADFARQAAEVSRKGSLDMQSASAQMEKVEDVVFTAGSVVEELGIHSEEIGRIIDTIVAIAGQTNLLALNAAIEAARAGEQGRGFAVVAEEVRKLAEQSHVAAKEITALVSGIQMQTKQAVQSMHIGTAEVKNGTQAIAAAGQTFARITESATRASQEVEEMEQSSQDVQKKIKNMSVALESMDEISQHTAEQIQKISEAVKDQSSSAETVAAASRELAVLAEKLQKAAQIFEI